MFEQNRTVIGIYMNSQHKDPKIWDPSFVGDGIAHWEGDELVADIVNQNGQGWIDDSGVPTSEKLHVVERWKKVGSRLEVTLTIDDPSHLHPSVDGSQDIRAASRPAGGGRLGLR